MDTNSTDYREFASTSSVPKSGTITVGQFQELRKLNQESQLTDGGLRQLLADNGVIYTEPGALSREDADKAITILESFLKGVSTLTSILVDGEPGPEPAGIPQEAGEELDTVKVLRVQMDNTLTVLEQVLKQHGQMVQQIQVLAATVATMHNDMRNHKHNVTRLEGEVRKVADSVRGK